MGVGVFKKLCTCGKMMCRSCIFSHLVTILPILNCAYTKLLVWSTTFSCNQSGLLCCGMEKIKSVCVCVCVCVWGGVWVWVVRERKRQLIKSGSALCGRQCNQSECPHFCCYGYILSQHGPTFTAEERYKPTQVTWCALVGDKLLYFRLSLNVIILWG